MPIIDKSTWEILNAAGGKDIYMYILYVVFKYVHVSNTHVGGKQIS